MPSINRYRFNFNAVDHLLLPAYPGSALRGIFGYGLRKCACVTALRDCSVCPLRSQCVYTYLFETSVFTGGARNAPNPMVLDISSLKRDYSPGSSFSIELTLIGKANSHIPYVIQAWRRAGKRGLGHGNKQFEVTSVESLDFTGNCWNMLFPETEKPCTPAGLPEREARSWKTDRLGIKLTTPYRGKLNGHLVTPKTFTAQGFVIALIKRLAILQRLHDPEGETLNTNTLIELARDVTMEGSVLYWKEWTRHSSRQSTHMQMGGVTGTFILRSDRLESLLPILELGQWIHAGKNTMFGLGRYRIAHGTGSP